MDTLFFAHLLDGLLMIAMPLGLAIYLTRKWKLSWRLWFIGAATFILSQVGHSPFISLSTKLLNQPPLADLFQNMSLTGLIIFNGAFVGLAAGLFEELFRYAMFRWWAKDARSWPTAVLTGAGHGGVEAIFAGGLALSSFFQLLAYRNINLSTAIPPEQLQAVEAQAAAYWSTAWSAAFLPALERLLTIIIHISMAVLVLQTFTRKQWFWVWLAVLYHSFIDFFTVPTASGVISQLGGGLILCGFAVISLIIIFLLRRRRSEIPAQPNTPQTTFSGGVLKKIEELPKSLNG